MTPSKLLNVRFMYPILYMVAVLAAINVGSLQANESIQSTADTTNTATIIPGVTRIEQITDNGTGIVIPYSKYRLDNGLTLIIHQDTSDPLVHVDVTYHVGSAREEFGRSGFAHFFEHMMFQGSAHVGDEQHFKIVSEAGGRLNGTTNADRTNYFETAPNNQLETLLWLEADRMGFLLEAVTEEKFEVQRATVKNERGQNVENRPYGRLHEINSAALYPADHPYAWPTIGFPEDLDAATLDDLKRFFLRWYGPNNATLTVGGNVEPERVIRLVKKYFGGIPRGPKVAPNKVYPVNLDTDRYVSYVDKNIHFPALVFTYPTVPLAHTDQVALDCLASLIGSGKKSLFYKKFVLTKKALQAQASHYNGELAGSLMFFVVTYPGIPLSEFESDIRAVLNNFGADDISDEDLQIFKAHTEARLINSLASVSGKVSQLAFNETFLGDPNYLRKELAVIRNLDKTDVLRVFNKYVKGQHAVIQSVLPPGMENGAAKTDNFSVARNKRDHKSAAPQNEYTLRAVKDDFDRSLQPTPGKAPLVETPPFWRKRLANGIEIIGAQSSEIPTVSMLLNFAGGHLLEQPGQFGLADLTATLMNEGTEKLSAERFEVELQKLGSQIYVAADTNHTFITMNSLRDQLDNTLALLQQRLYESRFTEADFARLKQQQIESIKAEKEQPSAIANSVYSKLLYGDGHRRAVSGAGNVESLENITLQDTRTFRDRQLSARTLQVVVVGDITREQVLAKLDFLKRLPATEVELPKQPATPTPRGDTLYLVDKPGAPQSEIRIGYLTNLPYDATGEYFKRDLMNFVLGDVFNSRINLNLREDKGYTYGARSGFSGNRQPGPFTAGASVKTEASADAVRQFMMEIKHYRNKGITDRELQFMRRAIGQRDALAYETPWQKTGFLNQIIEFDLPKNFVKQQAKIINHITKEEINELARKHLPTEKMMVVVVGDADRIYPSLTELSYDIVRLDANAQPIANND